MPVNDPLRSNAALRQQIDEELADLIGEHPIREKIHAALADVEWKQHVAGGKVHEFEYVKEYPGLLMAQLNHTLTDDFKKSMLDELLKEGRGLKAFRFVGDSSTTTDTYICSLKLNIWVPESWE
jgi:hypothetical protein